MVVQRRPISADVGVCGDSVRNGSESCDGADLGSGTCATQGFGCGALACKTDGSCTYDTSGCIVCQFPYAFSCDLSTTCFNKDTGAADWAVSGGTLNWTFSHTLGVERETAVTATAAGQYAQATITIADNTKLTAGGMALRMGASSTSARYVVGARADSSRVRWSSIDSSGVRRTLDTNLACGTWASADVMKVGITGTGATTTASVYQNGTLRCTMTGTNGAGPNTGCDPTGVGNAACAASACCADTGNYVGVSVDPLDDNAGNWSFDDFSGGVFP